MWSNHYSFMNKDKNDNENEKTSYTVNEYLYESACIFFWSVLVVGFFA